MNVTAILLTEWLLTYAIHSTVLLGLAVALHRWVVKGRAHWQELVWKSALLGPLLSASLQMIMGAGWSLNLEMPAQRMVVPVRNIETVAPVASVPLLPIKKSLPMLAAPAPKAHAPALGFDSPWLGAWLLGAAFMLARLQLSAYRLRLMLLRRQQFPHTLRPANLPDWVQVSLCDRINQPMAVGRREICVPHSLLSMPREQVDAALAHELAHLRRGDGLWRWACLAIQSALFFQPLNFLAARYISQAAEQGSDALALKSGTPRVDLVNVLASFSLQAQSPPPALASAMAGRPNEVVTRIENLLNGQLRTAPRLRAVLATVFLLALTAGLVLPGISAGDSRTSTEISISDEGDGTLVDIWGDENSTTRMSVKHIGDGLKITLNTKGAFAFDDNEQRLQTLNGTFDFTVSENGSKHRYRVTGSNSVLKPEFWVNGSLQDFDDEAAAWFAAQLPRLFRVTGLDAEARAQRIFKRTGMGGLISEVSMVESDHTRRKYLSGVATEQLSSEQASSLMAAGTQLVSSDLELRQLLSTVAKHQAGQLNWQDYFAATGSLQSDLEQRQALRSALDHLPSEPTVADAYVFAAISIDSDLEQRQALEALVKHPAFVSVSKELMLETAGKIGSDLEQRHLLATMVKRGNLTEPEMAALVDHAAEQIGSDIELRQLLTQVLRQRPGELVQLAVKRAADTLGDMERQSLLRNM